MRVVAEPFAELRHAAERPLPWRGVVANVVQGDLKAECLQIEGPLQVGFVVARRAASDFLPQLLAAADCPYCLRRAQPDLGDEVVDGPYILGRLIVAIVEDRESEILP